VPDPSALFLADRQPGVPGSVVAPVLDGQRPLLVEVQALVGPTEIVPPRRVAIGVDRTRLAQVIAVLSRHAGVRLGDADVFVSVAGGARALDPAADLAMALAITGAHRGVPLAAGTVAFGELGLTGAVRLSGHTARRLSAAAAHGMDVAITPPPEAGGESGTPRPAQVHAVPGVREALEAVFS
jgi:DNA repair protein RadA/Sms